MIPLSEDMQLALMQERDTRDLADLDKGLIQNVRNMIKELPEGTPERDCLVDYIADLINNRIDKITRMVLNGKPIDPECAQKEEVELYTVIKENVEHCAEKLGVELNRGGDEE